MRGYANWQNPHRRTLEFPVELFRKWFDADPFKLIIFCFSIQQYSAQACNAAYPRHVIKQMPTPLLHDTSRPPDPARVPHRQGHACSSSDSFKAQSHWKPFANAEQLEL